MELGSVQLSDSGQIMSDSAHFTAGKSAIVPDRQLFMNQEWVWNKSFAKENHRVSDHVKELFENRLAESGR